jgi:DNA repair ATPase RecN
MDLDDIKRGLRAEIKKRENEQYATCQCNVRQMCKDVLAKLEEQESVIAEKDKKIQSLEYLCENYICDCDNLGIMTDKLKKAGRSLRQKMNHQKYKRCMAMAQVLEHVCPITNLKAKWRDKWHKRWLELAEKFKEFSQT